MLTLLIIVLHSVDVGDSDLQKTVVVDEPSCQTFGSKAECGEGGCHSDDCVEQGCEACFCGSAMTSSSASDEEEPSVPEAEPDYGFYGQHSELHKLAMEYETQLKDFEKDAQHPQLESDYQRDNILYQKAVEEWMNLEKELKNEPIRDADYEFHNEDYSRPRVEDDILYQKEQEEWNALQQELNNEFKDTESELLNENSSSQQPEENILLQKEEEEWKELERELEEDSAKYLQHNLKNESLFYREKEVEYQQFLVEKVARISREERERERRREEPQHSKIIFRNVARSNSGQKVEKIYSCSCSDKRGDLCECVIENASEEHKEDAICFTNSTVTELLCVNYPSGKTPPDALGYLQNNKAKSYKMDKSSKRGVLKHPGAVDHQYSSRDDQDVFDAKRNSGDNTDDVGATEYFFGM